MDASSSQPPPSNTQSYGEFLRRTPTATKTQRRNVIRDFYQKLLTDTFSIPTPNSIHSSGNNKQ